MNEGVIKTVVQLESTLYANEDTDVQSEWSNFYFQLLENQERDTWLAKSCKFVTSARNELAHYYIRK